MNVMTKRGSLDNIVTYEHFCDSKADLDNIPKSQITLGSTAIVLQDENDSMGVYLATSQKEWVEISTSMNGGSTAVELLHICSSGEYDSETKVPTVEEPDENMLYLVPNNGEGNNLFDEWIYADGEWEKFSGTEISIPTPDWNVDSSDVAGYIDNKPAIKSGTGTLSIIENGESQASASYSHAEGWHTIAAHVSSHAEGQGSANSGEISFKSNGVDHAYVPGAYAVASHVEGDETIVYNGFVASHAEGYRTMAGAPNTGAQPGDHAEGYQTVARGGASHSEGYDTIASGQWSHAEGHETTASKVAAHAEGQKTVASGAYSHSEGLGTTASGDYSHAEGCGSNNKETTINRGGENYTYISGAFGDSSHSEGYCTRAASLGSHSEGTETISSGVSGHSEGIHTIASGSASHAEGLNSIASGENSHAEGSETTAESPSSHAEGQNTIASNSGTHAEGLRTIADSPYQHVFGRYNVKDTQATYVEIVGNGSERGRSNARTLDWSGNEWLSGNLTIRSGSLTLGSTTITESQLQTLLSLSSATGVGF